MIGPVVLRPIAPMVGGQPALTDIVGRDSDVRRFWASVAANSVTLNQPRRFGKSSLLRLVAAGPPAGVALLLLQVQGCSTTTSFVESLVASLHVHDGVGERTRHQLGGFLDRIESVSAGPVSLTLRAGFTRQPLATLQTTVETAAADLAREGRRLVIALDEFPDLVGKVIDNEGVTAAGDLLGRLRGLRETYPTVRWVLTGSVGLHHSLRRLPNSASYTTDLTALPLDPLDPDWSRWLAGCLLLGSGRRADPALMAELAEITDGIPYLLHLLLAKARDLTSSGLSLSTDELFLRAVGDLDHAHQSTHLLSRVESHYGADAGTAEAILDAVAERPRRRAELGADALIEGDDDRLRRVLSWLELDHYTVKDVDGVVAWRYPALRRIWVQRRS